MPGHLDSIADHCAPSGCLPPITFPSEAVGGPNRSGLQPFRGEPHQPVVLEAREDVLHLDAPRQRGPPLLAARADQHPVRHLVAVDLAGKEQWVERSGKRERRGGGAWAGRRPCMHACMHAWNADLHAWQELTRPPCCLQNVGKQGRVRACDATRNCVLDSPDGAFRGMGEGSPGAETTSASRDCVDCDGWPQKCDVKPAISSLVIRRFSGTTTP